MGVKERPTRWLLAAIWVAASCGTLAATDAPQRPFPQHVTYADGTIRPNHRTQARQDDDVRESYSRWKADFLANVEGGRYRIKQGPGADAPTVSEGQGYGMVIVALMAGHDPEARTIFDGLWRYVQDHPSRRDARLMSWKVPAGGKPGTYENSAFDGDADIAYGLLLAGCQWGSDYRAAAGKVLAGMLDREIGPESRLPMLGDWTRTDGTPHHQYTPRPSDFMPSHFRVFARVTGNTVWNQVATACQNATVSIQNQCSPETGLLPDFAVMEPSGTHAVKPAPGKFLETEWDGCYNFNAGRVPWRIGLDALLNADPVSTAQVRKMADWMRRAASGDPRNIKPGYQLNGEPIPGRGYFSTFFAAPFGVAAMAAGQQAWLNDIYDAVHSERQGYYADSVTLQCLLVMTGNYWAPAN